MSMILEKENNRIKVLIPNSEATISAQIKNIKDSEVTGYYTNDKDEIKKELTDFLSQDYNYILSIKETISTMEELNKYKDEFGYIFKDSMNNVNESYNYFNNITEKFIRIPKMYFSGVDNRYFKFDNQDLIVKNLRNILYGDITGFYILRNDEIKVYVIYPFVRENVIDILNGRKTRIDTLNKQNVEMNDLRKFYINNLENNELVEQRVYGQEKFIKEYPISLIRNLTLDDYCLGLDNYKNSFCYKLAYGEYKNTGFGIGSGAASKFGIYFSGNDYKYHGKNNILIEDNQVDEYFEEFKRQLVEFIIYMGQNEFNFDINEKYPLLGGSGNYMFLTKLLCLYYPDKYIAMSKPEVYEKLNKYLNIKNQDNAIMNSYYANIEFRNIVPEANENHGFYIANAIWKFFEENEELEEGDSESMRDLFKQWLLENGLMITTVNGYINTINLTTKESIEDKIIDKDIFNIKSETELDIVIEKLSVNEKFLRRKEKNHNQNSAALNHYRSFLSENKKSITTYEKYDKEKFLSEVFVEENQYDSLVSILEKKKNIILEGAPGVGKTFMAKRLAYSIIGEKDSSKVELIQFHQNYSYEDFVEGYRPVDAGFELQRGIFYKLCKKANNDKLNNYYLIIDEINRGNLSKIFGELLMLIEADKREDCLTLAYSEEKFSVPENIYIIGLMNTADRSLALIDYALRRRFSFIRIEPAFENEKFRKAFNEKFENNFNNLIEIVKKINEAIEQDKSLGAGFKIGHSYFCPNLKDRKGNKKDIEEIINYEILPLLEEYWYDDPDSIIQWKDALSGVLND